MLQAGYAEDGCGYLVCTLVVVVVIARHYGYSV